MCVCVCVCARMYVNAIFVSQFMKNHSTGLWWNLRNSVIEYYLKFDCQNLFCFFVSKSRPFWKVIIVSDIFLDLY